VKLPIPMVARYRAWVRGGSLAGNCGFEYYRGHGCLSVLSVICCQVEVSATG